MFKFNNDHIFTGYLKQLLSSFNLPTCKIYTREFAEYLEKNNKEDPRIIESFDSIVNSKNINNSHLAVRVNYLKNNEIYNYFCPCSETDSNEIDNKKAMWIKSSNVFYETESSIPGLTKTLKNNSYIYDTSTHEYLGEYLRFLRDYYDVNLMSLYNCFNNKIYNNIYFKNIEANFEFDSRNPNYHIYALPVKLFCDYTIAIDCNQPIELFCGFYKTQLDNNSDKAEDFRKKTYMKVNRTRYKQPFIYDKLNVKNWTFESDTASDSANNYYTLLDSKKITRWDIISREQDLKLFIKIPISCKSSITILEGDFRHYNDFIFNCSSNAYNIDNWEYKQNKTIINFEDKNELNDRTFRPISKLQLLALNTGESYPFADRLVEYLCNSAITPIDSVADNIKRAQKVMSQNKYYFKIPGLWEDKMQMIIYDYIMGSGPVNLVKVNDNGQTKRVLKDARIGYYPRIGHNQKSLLFDTLGYIDRDAEKWYTRWINKDGKVEALDTISNVDIYNGLFDI